MFEYLTKTFSYFESFFEPQTFDPTPQDYTLDANTEKLLTTLFQSRDYIQMLQKIENEKNVTIIFTPFNENCSSFKGTNKNKFSHIQICYDKSLNDLNAQQAIFNVTKQTFSELFKIS